MNLKQLCEPFAPNEIEWRIGQSGTNAKGVWAKVLAYVTNRAIMQRLDDVCGPENWRNEYRYEPSGAVLCGISVKVAGEWITKWDGAENTDIEAVKGGLSNAMKRAAVQWGIGRYLYDLEEGWATISENGEHYVPKNDKKGMPAFRWSPPKLPSWAMPNFVETAAARQGEPVKGLAFVSKPKAAKPAEDDLYIMPTGPWATHPISEVPIPELQALAKWCREHKNASKYAARLIALETEINRRADTARENGDLHPALAGAESDNLGFK
jgi:hypothetical protein